MDKYIGKKLDGRYEIQEIIGIGGMANVYKAYDVIENRVVAVKILRDEYVDNEEFLRRFKNESKAIAVLSHPNIVKVYDVSFTNRMQSIVMEYIDGITLKEYIEQQRVLKWKEAVHFTVQILRALQHAHDKGIVHRDIKPQNVMLLSDGTIKITDFGIARFARSESKTLTDRAIGSVHYISPEQAQGGVTDERTDIYSVGVMLFEMLTGTLPFEADSPVSVALKQIQSTPKRPREINPDIPEGLEDITMRAMQKDIAGRYQSAAEMLRDIDEFKRNPSISFEYKYLSAPLPSETKRMKQTVTPENKKTASAAKSTGHKKKKERQEDEAEKRAPVIPILGGITLAFVLVTALFIGGMFYFNNPFEKVPDVDLPDMRGMSYEKVKNDPMYSQNFKIQVEGNDYSEEYPLGTIMDQDPKPNRKVKVGSLVKVRVSNGPKRVVVPPLAGDEATVAFGKLNDLGLAYSETKTYSDDVAEGYVIGTDPAAGSEVQGGANITVYVSMGGNKKMIKVPDVTGLPLDSAKLMLNGYKLKVGTVTPVESNLPAGTVIDQDPSPESQIETGSFVNLTVVASDTVETTSQTVYIQLPSNIDRVVEVSATLDGKEVHRLSMNPAQTRVWKPAFEGEGAKTVKIYIEGKIYQVYEIDFDLGTATPVDDYSADFE